MNEPQDPITELAEAAASQHEMFMAWVEAGFTESQAMELMKTVIMGFFGGGHSRC